MGISRRSHARTDFFFVAPFALDAVRRTPTGFSRVSADLYADRYLLAMASKIERALRQALTTFSSVQENFNDNFAILRQLVGELDAESVGLDPMLLRYDQYEILEMYEMHDNDPLLESRNRRPVPITFIKIFENDQLSASVFVLRDGAKIPLHNHPYMHGLLKVIHGKVKIQSFTIACSQSYHRR